MTHMRFAYPSRDLPAIRVFYRDLLGLEEAGGFEDHEGYSGVIFSLPASLHQLEFTYEAQGAAPSFDLETLIVLYYGDATAVARAVECLDFARVPRVAPANPYWRKHAVSFRDPDGRCVVLAYMRKEPIL